MKLSDMQVGNCGKIISIEGGSSTQTRITSVGLIPGTVVEVMKNSKRYPMLIFAKSTLLALDRKECSLIEMEVTK